MGKNKGKGAANLRRINTAKAKERAWEKEHAKIKESPWYRPVSFTLSIKEQRKWIKPQ